MLNFNNLPFFHNKQKATFSLIPSKFPARKNISFFDSVREICDNSIDAGADNINIIISKNQIFFIDNGKGMNKDDLNNALVTGLSGKTDKSNSLGKFGVGLNQSIAQFNKDANTTQAHFLSMTWNNTYHKPTYAYIKICPEEINKNLKINTIDGWKIEPSVDLYAIDKDDIQKYLIELTSEYIWQDGPFQSGTIVGIIKTSIPELKNKNNQKLIDELSCHLGMAYYTIFKNKKLKITITYKQENKNIIVPVNPIDLLLRNEPNVDLILEKEYTHNKCISPLKVSIVVTPKDTEMKKPDKELITDNSPFYINNSLNGIALKHNGVIINSGIKSIPVSESLAEKIRTILKDNNLNKQGTLRKEFWWNTNDSYSSPIRVMIEINSEWHIQKLIQLDQEKTSFEFHEDMNDILADLYLQLNIAYTHCKQKNDKKNNTRTTNTRTTNNTNKITQTNAPITTNNNTNNTIPKTNKLELNEWTKLSQELARNYDENIRAELFDFSNKLYNKLYME